MTYKPCTSLDVTRPRLDGSCNNIDHLEYGARSRVMGGVLFGTHERQYLCNPSRGPFICIDNPPVCTGDPPVCTASQTCSFDREQGRGWSCGYFDPVTNVTRPLPLERDVHRYIHQSKSVLMNEVGATTPDQDELNYLFMGWANMFLGHEGQATKGVFAATAPVGSPECGNLCGDYSSLPEQRFYVTDVPGQEFVDSSCDAYNATLCGDEILYEPDSFLPFPPFNVFKGGAKRYPPAFFAPTPYPGELFVPWQSLIKHDQDEVVPGDNKKSTTSHASAWMHLHTVYGSNLTRFDEIKSINFATNGELASRTVDSMDGVFSAQSDDRTSYCDLTETVYTDVNTFIGSTNYSSAGVCWAQGNLDNPSMVDPWCYSTGGEGHPPSLIEWWILDMDTSVSTCMGHSCDLVPDHVVVKVGGNCSKLLRAVGDCSPHNVIRSHCDVMAARHNLDPVDYVISYTAGLLPNTQIHDFPITATDAGIVFNGDTFRDYRHPSETIVMGDERAHANAPLSFWQILYFREHNSIAREIKTHACSHKWWLKLWMKPCSHYYNSRTGVWNGQRIFDDARMINIGQAQHHYKKIIERITGHRFKYKKYRSYDKTRDPRMTMEMAMANRGHTMVAHDMYAVDSCGTRVTKYNFGGTNGRNAHDWHSVHQYFAAGSVDNMLYGLASQKLPAMDHLSEMFLNLPGIFTLRSGINIPSFTLARSRDANLGTYTDVWKAYHNGESFEDSTGCGDPTSLACFKALAKDVDDVPGRLRALYGNVNNVDLWTGYESEYKGPNGSIFGRLKTKIMIAHTKNLIYGDRFWYENANQHGFFVRRRMKSLSIRELILKHSNDRDTVDQVLGNDIFDTELNFFDDSCSDTVTYMPPPGVSV